MSAVAIDRSTARSQRQELMRILSRIAPIIVLVILAAIYLTPFVWMVSTSLKTQAQSIVSPPVLVPGPITVDAFPQAWCPAAWWPTGSRSSTGGAETSCS
jgi:ABC-type glycerol-3-phosphate transport system permease component